MPFRSFEKNEKKQNKNKKKKKKAKKTLAYVILPTYDARNVGFSSYVRTYVYVYVGTGSQFCLAECGW